MDIIYSGQVSAFGDPIRETRDRTRAAPPRRVFGDAWQSPDTRSVWTHGGSRFGINRSPAGIDRAVSRVVRHASRTIPYYSELFGEVGVSPDRIRTVEDLARLPLTHRNTLAARPIADVTDPTADLAKCFRHQTSGSTGSPLTVHFRSLELRYRQLLLARVLWKAAPVLPPVRIVELGRVMRTGRHVVNRGLLWTAVKPAGQASPGHWLQWLDVVRPQIVEGFPTILEILARYCAEHSIVPPKPRIVVSRGETLFPDARQLIEDTFQTRIMDLYSCQEIGNIAWQCPSNPSEMHINTDACVVEVVDDQGRPVKRGMSGLLVLTNLYNLTMPFVRYVIGDRGRLLPDAPARCACGSRRPRMALVEGRADDILLLPDGRRISPRVAATVLFRSSSDGRRIQGIRRYQLVQEAADRLVLRAVLGEAVDADWREALVTTARERLGGLHLDIEEVSEIPLEPSGKFKRVISRV